MYEKLPTLERKFTPEESLEEFRSAIKKLKDLETEEGKSVHLRDLNPENLNEKDLKMYEDFLKVNDKETLNSYIEELEEHKTKLREDKNTGQDQKDFAAFLGNMVMGKMGRILDL